jgi:hypothetical protein
MPAIAANSAPHAIAAQRVRGEIDYALAAVNR